MSIARFLVASENQSAFLAISALCNDAARGRAPKGSFPLVLHGPSGTGKTHLVMGLAREVASNGGGAVQILSGGDFREPTALRQDKKTLAVDDATPVPASLADNARECDLLILEDIQRVPLAAAEVLVQILDYRQAHELPSVVTSTSGPRHLVYRGVRFPARLTSRLAGGLVIALEPLGVASRQKFLEESAQRQQLALPRDVAVWLARNLTGGGRQLQGAIAQLITLSKVGSQPLDLKTVMAHFHAQVEAIRPTVERIAVKVGSYYRVEPRELQSRHQQRGIVLPRQISMYLARDLTSMSLEQIGAYFGGRDHTTVLHACRKVAQALKKDAVLSGTVRQIHAELA